MARNSTLLSWACIVLIQPLPTIPPPKITQALGRMASLTGSEGFGPPAATKRLKEAALKVGRGLVSEVGRHFYVLVRGG